MDPAVSAFLTKVEANIEASMDAHTKAQQVTATRIDELLARLPNLEYRVADLGDAVAALQQAQPPPSKATDEDPAMREQPQPPPVIDGVHTR